MKKIIFYLFITIISFCIYSFFNEKKLEPQNLNPNIDIQKLESYLEEKIGTEEKVIIIPGSGCDGCISEAETFLYNNLKNSNSDIIFILTKSIDLKMTLFRLGIDKKNLPKSLIIDKYSTLCDMGYDCIYPMILSLKNKKIQNVEFNAPGRELLSSFSNK